MSEDLREFIEATARGAGEIQNRSFGKIERWDTKTGPGDIVTEVDYESERYILDRINQAYPHDSIVSEESGKIMAPSLEKAVEEGRTWIIDPLDGTRNFALGIPFFCVSIGLVEKGQVTHGAIYDPVHDQLFYAERGKGTTLNGQPIHVSQANDLVDAVVSISWVRSTSDSRRFINYMHKVSKHSSYFRRLGAAALVMCYVACGRFDAYVQGGLNPWDVAAGIVIIEEAGGVVTDLCDNPLDLSQAKLEILTANPVLHKILMEKFCVDITPTSPSPPR